MKEDLVLSAILLSIKEYSSDKNNRLFNGCNFSFATQRILNFNDDFVMDGNLVRFILSSREDIRVHKGSGYYEYLGAL